MDGGRSCLALVNSVWWRRSDRPQDQLRGYADLVDVGGGRVRSGPAAHSALRRGIRLREALYAVLSAAAAGEPVPAAELSEVNGVATAAAVHRELRPDGPGLVLAWTEPDAVDRPAWQCALSAVELLTAAPRARLKQCPGERCGWLFVDRTRNHSRRWCDGRECGNRQRVRAHYERRRERSGTALRAP
jgi:predicted RNA-binding Zn ribbon-like protein